MSIKYIQETKKGEWKVSATKTGKSLRTLETKKDAIIYASSIKATSSIFVKNEGKWFETLEDESKQKPVTKTTPKKRAATKKKVVTKTTTKKSPNKMVVIETKTETFISNEPKPKKKVVAKKPAVKKTTTKATPKKKVVSEKPTSTQHEFIVEKQKQSPTIANSSDKKEVLSDEGRVGKWYRLLIVFIFLFAITGAFIAAWFLVN